MLDSPTPTPTRRIVVNEGDLCTLAPRQRGEDRQSAAVAKIVRLIQEREAARVVQ